jgi:hypothetical protein
MPVSVVVHSRLLCLLWWSQLAEALSRQYINALVGVLLGVGLKSRAFSPDRLYEILTRFVPHQVCMCCVAADSYCLSWVLCRLGKP